MKNKNKFLYIVFSIVITWMCCVGIGVDARGPDCGNGSCEEGETNMSCPADCAPIEVCGNGYCEGGETNTTCPADCNSCGDDTCDELIGETPITCSVDCLGAVCGDGTCDNTENIATCPSDCVMPDPQPDPGTSTPSCENMVINVGEKTTCSVKIENTKTFPLTEVTATVVIPQEIIKVDHTDLWNCSSIVAGTECQKSYNPYLLIGEIDYLELTFTTDVEGQYGLSTSIDGKGESFQTVAYSSSEEITIIESATAIAVDDLSMCSSGMTDKDLAANDMLCSSGTTTFAYHNLISGVTITSFNANTGVISYTFDSGDIYDTVLLQYDILCNGVVTDTADLTYTCA